MPSQIYTTGWGRIADMSSTPVYPEITEAMLATGKGVDIIPKAHANANGGVTGFVGYFCVMALSNGSYFNYSAPFNFSVNSDLNVILNSTSEVIDPTGTQWRFDMEGSVDGTNWTRLADNFAINEDADGLPAHGLYDIDLYGIMPLMRLNLQNAGTDPDYENVLIHVIPN